MTRFLLIFFGFFAFIVISLSLVKEKKIEYKAEAPRTPAFEKFINFPKVVFSAVNGWVGGGSSRGSGGGKCDWLEPGKIFDSEAYLRETNNQKLISEVEKDYGDIIRAICYHEDFKRVDLVFGIIIRESSNNPKAHFGSRNSSDTGLGLMGVTKDAALEVKIIPDSLFIPHQNITAGVRYLKKMLEKTGEKMTDAVVAYTCGFGGYQENIAKGRRAVDNIYYQQVKALADLVPAQSTKN